MRVVSGCSPVKKAGRSNRKDPQKAQAKKENLKTVRGENAELSAGSGLARAAHGAAGQEKWSEAGTGSGEPHGQAC